MKSPKPICWHLTRSESLRAKISLSSTLGTVLWGTICSVGMSASVQALEMVRDEGLFRFKVASVSTNGWSISDFEEAVPGIRGKIVDDLANRGFLSYTAEQVLLATKKKQAVMVVDQADFNTRGIEIRQGKVLVPTIDSPVPLEYSLDVVVVQKLKFDLREKNPDVIARSQRVEMFGVPKARFADLYYNVKGALYFSREKTVICVISNDRLPLKTAWGNMQVEPGDAIMYPIGRRGDVLVVLPPYRHAGGEVLNSAYSVEKTTSRK